MTLVYFSVLSWMITKFLILLFFLGKVVTFLNILGSVADRHHVDADTPPPPPADPDPNPSFHSVYIKWNRRKFFLIFIRCQCQSTLFYLSRQHQRCHRIRIRLWICIRISRGPWMSIRLRIWQDDAVPTVSGYTTLILGRYVKAFTVASK
jgi:hypothetical protein